MNNIGIALAVDYHEEVNYALVQSKMHICNWCIVEKENVRLAAENERMKKAFPDAVKREVEKRTKVLVEERQKAENERDKALVQNRTLTIDRDKAVTQLNRQKADEQQRVENAVKLANAEKDKIIRVWQNAWKTNREVLNILADMLFIALLASLFANNSWSSPIICLFLFMAKVFYIVCLVTLI